MNIFKNRKLIFTGQQGAALPMVLMLMVVMILLSAAAYQLSQGNTSIISRTTSNEKALYAAEQGYNRCLWRLNNEDSSFFTAEDSSPEEITYGEHDDPYNLYEPEDGTNYRLNILVPLVEIDGQSVRSEDTTRRIIRSTGWDTAYPDHLRTIEVEIYKKAFTQYAMVNNTEIGASGNPIYWTTGEVLYGPLHTNATLYVTGTPVFYGAVTYVNGINIDVSENINNPAIFTKGNAVSSQITLPTSNPKLKALACIDGHYYKGRTCISLLGSGGYDVRYYNSSNNKWYYNGVEYVFSKTKDGTSNTNSSNCWTSAELQNEAASSGTAHMIQRVDNGNWYSSFAAFAATTSSLPLPPNRVIYVDGTTGGDDRVGKFAPDLANVFVSGKLSGRLTIAAANNIYITGYNPCDWKKPVSSWFDNEDAGVIYQNTDFSQEEVNGKWDHTAVTGVGEDMLGLVSNSKVQIMHYNWPTNYHEVYYYSYSSKRNYNDYCWSGDLDVAPENIKIYAAIFTCNMSFGFESHTSGSQKNDINLIGSLTQNIRGAVGTIGSTGYDKIYCHDPRMLYYSPPFFPEPSNTGWRSARWDEISNHIE